MISAPAEAWPVASPLLPLSAALALTLALTERGALRLAAIYVSVALALSIYSLGLRGANVNRLLEPALATIPLVAWAWQRWRHELLAVTIALAVASVGVLQSAPSFVSDRAARQRTAAIERLLQSKLTPGQTVLTLAIGHRLRRNRQGFRCDAPAGWQDRCGGKPDRNAL